MRSQVLPLISAVVLGFAVATLSFSLGAPQRAEAQFKGTPPVTPFPSNLPSGGGAAAAPSYQPLEIQALDQDHFVVATREPRLVQQVGREGTAQNMLVTVVTHYTVRGDKLIPVEHVRVPAGYRAISIEE